MVARHLILYRNLTVLKTSLLIRRTDKFPRQLPLRYIHQYAPPPFPRNVRSASTHSALKKTVPLFLGLSLAGGGIAAWYFREKSSLAVEENKDEFEDIPFVHEHLEEDLRLLSEFGPVPYLLIGAGSASLCAYRAIRTRDPTAKVLMIGEEPFVPYMRPPLSKEVWFDLKSDVAETLSFVQWDGRSRSLFYEPTDYYFPVKELLENKNGGISIIRGKKVVRIDPTSQVVYLDSGEKILYNKCLVATGSKPKNLPVFENADESVRKHVTLFRTIRDFQRLDKLSMKAKNIVIVGGGFLGSELACGLAHKMSDLEVTQVFPESGNMGKVLPEYLSMWTSGKLIEEGVKVISNVDVKSVSKDGDHVVIELSNNQILKTDHVIVAVGADPNTDIAKASGLEVDEKFGGFLVNTEMEARKNLWVAGDASCFYDSTLGRRRVEHHDQAIVTGRLAGENMTGDAKPYWHQSMFWSDLGPKIGFEAIGIVDSSLPTIGVFAKENETNDSKSATSIQKSEINNEESEINTKGTHSKTHQQLETKSEISGDVVPRAPNPSDNYEKGVLFYLRDDVIVGILLWNVFAKMQIARQIINEAKSSDDITEVAKLFELHSSDLEE